MRGLSVQFGRHRALSEVGFALPTGAFGALVGPNGAGKSTLLRALLGLVRPHAGAVWVLGEAPARATRRVGYVPQLKTFDRSFPALARELVASGERLTWPTRMNAGARTRAAAALEEVGAGHLAERRIGRLSGGELQRVYLARALARSPQLILLDEPATGMDTLGERDLYALLEAAQRARPRLSILMITHDLDVARHHASHVAVLSRRLVAYGSPAQALCERCLAEAYGHAGHAHARAPHRHGPAEDGPGAAGAP